MQWWKKKTHSVFGFGLRPTVSVYSVSAKNFHFGASLVYVQVYVQRNCVEHCHHSIPGPDELLDNILVQTCLYHMLFNAEGYPWNTVCFLTLIKNMR